jgi:WD40 repeat protein/serine/threonine protein kinase/tetratricopeptide (TPR) repeat protein
MTESSWDRNPIDKLADEFLSRHRRGENPSVTEYADKYPELADEIRDLFPALVMMEELKPGAPEESAADEGVRVEGKQLERLGDYRILREVGRGGMGIVYEAEQESLGRRVALKVLPAQAMFDPRQQKRFQREAKAAARLHHTNIVPVFGVGEHEGLHYYVMQFIQGLGLDQVLRELKRMRKAKAGAAPAAAEPLRRAPSGGSEPVSAGNVAQALLTGKFAAAGSSPGASPQPSAGAAPLPATLPYAGSSHTPVPAGSSSSAVWFGQSDSSSLSESGRHYWQSLARIGIQVAEALDYAHSQGVFHRDIKPSNLLLDNQGTVWVTDFGLAKASAAEGDDLTHTGDIIGTLRYMAPERFQGQSDARCDIYSLGLTLYEMLILRPAFDETDHKRLIHQVTHEEPPRPRKLNRAIPRDLETIVLKATEREPARRYQTPRAMADDLQRFLDDKPIQARQVGPTERLWRWCRRNPALAWATGLAAAALVAATVVSIAHALAQSRYSVNLVEEQRQTQLENERAEAARQHAEGLAVDLASSLEASRTLSATMAVEKAQSSIQQRQLHRGMSWLARALELTPAENRSLQQYIRTSLDSIMDEAVVPQTAFVHPGRIDAMAFSRSGKLVATGGLNGREGEVRLWDANTGQPHGGVIHAVTRVVSLAISPDETKILGGGSGEAWLWDAATGKLLGPSIPQPGWVYAVAFSPDGQHGLTVSGTEAHLWDLATGKRIGHMVPERGYLYCAAFSPDGKTIVTGGGDYGISTIDDESSDSVPNIGEARLWDASTGKPIRELASQRSVVLAVAYSPDGKTIVTGSYDRMARWYDAASGQPLGQPIAHPMWISALAFSPDSQTLLISGFGSSRLWDVRTRQPVGEPFLQQGTYGLGVAFDPSGQRVVIPSMDGTVRIWLLRTGRSIGLPLPHAGRVQLAAVSADSKTILTSSPEMQRWEAAAGAPVGPPLLLPDFARILAFSPGGKLLASTETRLGGVTASAIQGFGASKVAVRIWDPLTGKEVGPALWHEVAVYAAAFSADGKTLATASGPLTGGEIRLWDIATGKEVGAGLHFGNRILSLSLSPDGRKLATAGGAIGEGEAELWDLTRRERIGQPLPHAGRVRATAFSPDGQLLVTGSDDGTARIWEVATGRPVGAPLQHDGPVLAVLFSPDGQFILTGSDDKTARLWDVQTGRPIGTPMAHRGAVAALAFSPDGTFVVTGSHDKTAKLWRLPKPLPGTPDQIVRRVQATTGVRLNADGTTKPLDREAWNVHTKEASREGEHEQRLPSQTQDWHLLAALDAMEDGQWETASWHLDQHLQTHSEAWLAYVLRSRVDHELARPEQADSDWSEAFKRGPQAAVLCWSNLLAAQCFEKGDQEHMTAAVWYIERLAAAWPKDWPRPLTWSRVYASRAQKHVLAQRWQEAASDYDRATAFNPTDPQLWEEKGRFHIAREQWLPAADAFDHVLSLVPVERSQHSLRSRFCNDLAKWPQTLDRLLELRPRDSQLWVARARYRARLSQWEGAVADYQRADPDRPVQEEFQEHACALLVAGDHAGFRQLCKKLVERAGSNPDPFTAFVLARTCSASPEGIAEPQRAVRWGEQAVGSVAVPPAWYMHALGMACFRAGELEQAGYWLGRSHRSGWQRALDAIALAMIHHRLGRSALARSYLNEALAWSDKQRTASRDQPVPGYANDWLEFHALRLEAEGLLNAPGRREAEACLQKRQWVEAIGHLDQLIKADPASWTDRVLRSCALAESGQRAQAASEFSQATALVPRSPRPWLMRSRFYLDLGKLAEADGSIAEAVKLTAAQPAHLEFQLGLGADLAGLAQTALEGGHTEQGLAWWQQAAQAYRGAAAKSPEKQAVQEALADTLFALSNTQRRLRHPAEAMASAREIRQRWPRNNVRLYNAACEMALCVALVGEGKPELTAEERETRQTYTQEAVKTLHQAVGAGYKDFRHIRQDRDFDAIRSAVDFQTLVSRMEEGGPS